MKYKAIFPFVNDMGAVPTVTVSDKTMETKEEEALWHLNRYREHDGLEPLEELPDGMEFQPIFD